MESIVETILISGLRTPEVLIPYNNDNVNCKSPVFATFILSLIVCILHIIIKTLHLAHLASRPSGHILGDLLDIVDGVVPSLLDAIRDGLDFTDLRAHTPLALPTPI